MRFRSFWIFATIAFSPVAWVSAEEVDWRTTYANARDEAARAQMPIFVEIGSDHCVWCRKLEKGPLRNRDVVGLLNSSFVSFKLNRREYGWFVKTLGIRAFPTTIVAAPDGRILFWREGYMDASNMRRHLETTLGSLREQQLTERDTSR